MSKRKDENSVTQCLTMPQNLNFPSYQTTLPVIVHHGKKRRVLNIPVYSISAVDIRQCSKYVRMAALDLFGKTYTHSHAWNRRYKDILVRPIMNSSLEELSRRKILVPGMLVGSHNSDSALYNPLS